VCPSTSYFFPFFEVFLAARFAFFAGFAFFLAIGSPHQLKDTRLRAVTVTIREK
jgi:hypothetical protein